MSNEPRMRVTATGIWRLERNQTVGPATTAAALDAMPVRANGNVHVFPGGSVFAGRATVEGRPAFLSLRFLEQRLELMEIVLLRDGEAFTRENEERLKSDHDAWLQSLGFELGPLTYSVDGVDVSPADAGPARPLRAVCSWGQVTSMIDPRNGGASILVLYKRQ